MLSLTLALALQSATVSVRPAAAPMVDFSPVTASERANVGAFAYTFMRCYRHLDRGSRVSFDNWRNIQRPLLKDYIQSVADSAIAATARDGFYSMAFCQRQIPALGARVNG